MDRILLIPGEVGDLVEIDDILRARHDEARRAIQARIDRRQESGSPMDDGEDAPTLQQIPPYKENPAVKGVRVRCRVLDAFSWRDVASRELNALERVNKLAKGDAPFDEQRAAAERLFAVRRELVSASVAHLEIGAMKFDPFDARALAIVERNHMLGTLSDAAGVFQDLGPGKVSPSGSSLAQTSGATTATRALDTSVECAGAMVASSISRADPPTTPALAGPPTRARADTSSGIQT